jgi:serine/threonine protein kinase/tetratricopeptide (TPR) repeat protein
MTEETLFELALNTPAADRPALLDRECADNPALRARVEALLAAHEQLERTSGDLSPLSSAAIDEASVPEPGASPSRADAAAPTDGVVALAAGPTAGVRPAEGVGSVLAGRYKLVEEIGEGGMGIVWMAQQTTPVRRVVAVKVIKAGMDSRAVLARFEAERQALAMMDHPNIARVLDAGTTLPYEGGGRGGPGGGRPFFVMELVKGVPITRFCDERRLSPRQRLELFVPVCQAIQHAHQKGVIHRDIKPSNVLIALYDDRPVPKVIDFGVAKATGPALTEQTLLTGFGTVVGTPEYMSPEQATLNNLDIDTRSDVYALGVLLYELLTGTTPVDRRRLGQAAVLEVLRIVREVEPPAPSSRLSTLEGLPSIAANRSVEPARLARMLRGDLDWVVMKALEKDRSRRYETANALARDVQRYLADEAVEARPPSAGYRLRKFVRRNKGRVAAAGLVLLALVLGMLGTTWGLVRARWERDKAIQSETAERAARLHEEEQRKYAEAIAGFVRDDFLALTSVEGQQRFGDEPGDAGLTKDATLRQLLDRAAAKLSRRQDLDPRTEAELNWIVGVNYRGLGDAGRAVPYLERCVALRRQVLGRDEESTLNAQNSLAVAYLAVGKLDAALPLFEETLRQRKARLGPDHPDTLGSMNNLAGGYRDAGRLDLALPLLEETLRQRKARLGPDHPDTLQSMNNLAEGYRDAGRLDLALPLHEEALRQMKVRLGPDHPDTLTSMNNLAGGYRAAGKLDLALPLLEEALRQTKARLGPDHPDTLQSMNNLAAGYWSAHRLDRSVPLFEEALRLQEKKLGRNHPVSLMIVANLGVNYRDAGRLSEALPLLEEAYRASRTIPMLRWVGTRLLDGYAKAGRSAQAAALAKEVLADARKSLPEDSPQLAETLADLGRAQVRLRVFAEAEPLLRECLAIREKAEPQLWTTSDTRSLLGGAMLGQKRFSEAEPLLRHGYEGMKARLEAIPPIKRQCLPEALDRLIELYTATNRPDEVKKWRAERAKYSDDGKPRPAGSETGKK